MKTTLQDIIPLLALGTERRPFDITSLDEELQHFIQNQPAHPPSSEKEARLLSVASVVVLRQFVGRRPDKIQKPYSIVKDHLLIEALSIEYCSPEFQAFYFRILDQEMYIALTEWFYLLYEADRYILPEYTPYFLEMATENLSMRPYVLHAVAPHLQDNLILKENPEWAWFDDMLDSAESNIYVDLMHRQRDYEDMMMPEMRQGLYEEIFGQNHMAQVSASLHFEWSSSFAKLYLHLLARTMTEASEPVRQNLFEFLAIFAAHVPLKYSAYFLSFFSEVPKTPQWKALYLDVLEVLSFRRAMYAASLPDNH